jgi:hypothetical protein
MKHRNFKITTILIGLALVLGLLAPAAQATTYGLTLVTKDGSGNAKTDFIRGEKVYLHIIASELQGLAGCAFTLNYNSTILTAPATDAEGVAASGIISLFPFTFVKDSTTTVTMRENSSTAGKILFSGASIDTSTGGGKFSTSTGGSSYPLFVVEFTVKTDAPFNTGYAFSLEQTTLHNPDAGYGTSGGTEQVAVPILVGANAKGNGTDASWTDLTQAFPTLLASFATTPATTFAVIDVPTYTISGSITYTGKQAGTLKVGAFTNAGMTTAAGTAYTATWVGSSMNYTVSGLLGSASYYVGAFIDSGAANGAVDTTEAQGAYGLAIAIAAANVTGKNITLIESQTNGLPSYWYNQYSSFNGGQGIGNASADADHDGYSNLVEYQNGTDPTVANAPNGTGYNPTTDTRPYTISGTVYYNGTQTGTLNVAAFAATDTTYSTPIGTGYQVAWSGTSKTYTISVPNGTYKVGAYIESTGNSSIDTSEAQNKIGPFPISGANLTGRNITLLDTTAKVQIVRVNPASPATRAGGNFSLTASYSTSNNNQALTGLGLRIHYDSTKMTFNNFSSVLTTNKISQDTVARNDTSDLDGDPTTDKYVMIAWADGSETPAWPGAALPINLFTINFTAASGLAEGTTSTIRITGSSVAADYLLLADPVTFTVKAFNLDIDGNGAADALTDGLLVIRYLFGFSGNTTWVNGVVDTTNGTRKTAADIETYFASAGVSLDIDGNGNADALTDGLLVIRYLFGFSGNTTWVNGVVDTTNGTRKTAADIEAYLQPLVPAP